MLGVSAKKPFFITFEGVEAAGKSTQIELLEKKLVSLGIPVVTTREPGGTKLAEKIRSLFKQEEMDSTTQMMLVAAARRDHVQNFLKPHLNKKIVVISDRYQESSVVYQGFAGGLDSKVVKKLNNWATDGLKADRIFWIDLKFEEVKRRLSERAKSSTSLDRFDQASEKFHLKLYNGYKKLWKTQTKPKITRIEASGSAQSIHEEILAIVMKDLKKRFYV